MNDEVEHPSHYTQGNIECIKAIESALGDAFVDSCRAFIIKYAWRCRDKGNTLKDLKKAKQYCQFAIDYLEEHESTDQHM